VFEEDFQADADENQTAGQLDLRFEEASDAFADFPAEQGDDEGNQTDEQNGGKDVLGNQRERQSYSKGVDACGDAQGQQDDKVGRVGRGLFNFADFEGFKRHFAADKGQQAEGQPVVEGLDMRLEPFARRPAQKRHQGLEGPEEKGHPDAVADMKMAKDRPADDGDGKGIHRKGDGNGGNHKKFTAVHGAGSSRIGSDVFNDGVAF